MKKSKITLINIISSLILQIITIISYFIIPKIILNYFGSSVNGLISSINQFLNFITLIEGGITGVVLANLYKPLEENKIDKVNMILSTANNFYKKIGLIFIIYSICLGICYPIIFNSTFTFTYVFTLTLILSLNLFVQYMFAIINKTLLNADKKIYIVNFTQSLMIILNIILTYICVKIYPSIHLLKFISGILYFIQPILFNYYVKNKYKINYKNKNVDNDLLKQRWNGFAINVAAFIHICTDIAILTVFTDLKTVSIYSIYTLVTSGLRQIINAVSNAIVPTIGRAYASNNKKMLNNKFDLYEYIIFMLVFFSFTIAGLLITPFVSIYTNNINDANYYQPIFGYLILLSEGIYIIKFPHLNLAYSSNKFKEITRSAYTEALINIFISLLLVKKFGLIGIAIGTLTAMTYRMITQVNFTKKIIKKRNNFIFYKKIMIFSITSIIGIILCMYLFPLKDINLINWVKSLILYSIIFFGVFIITSILFFKKEINYIKEYLKR